jgi:hypothetical protein
VRRAFQSPDKVKIKSSAHDEQEYQKRYELIMMPPANESRKKGGSK